MKRNNPFDNFLFSIPGKHGKMNYKEMSCIKNIEKKDVEIIDVQSKRKLGRMPAYYALIKFL